MSQRLIAWFVCLVLAWTTVFPSYAAVPASAPYNIESLSQRFPNAKVIHVQPEEYPALEHSLIRRGYTPTLTTTEPRLLAQAGQESNASRQASRQNAEAGLSTEHEDECKDWETRIDGLGREEARALLEKCREVDDDESIYDSEAESGEGPSVAEDSFRMAIDFTEGMLDSNSDNDELAAVVFIVVGAVILVVWTLYVMRYLFDSQDANARKTRWSELMTTSSAIATMDSQHARFFGLRYMRGFKDDNTYVGISAELGQSDILLTEAGSLSLKGVYWLIGPMLRWHLTPSSNPDYFQLEFVAGSTEHPEMGIIALAKMGINFGTSEHLRWGFNMGAMNINLHANQGIITDLNQFYLLFGLEFGYRF